MYYSKIEAMAAIDSLTAADAPAAPTTGETLLGLALLIVGLPILAVRLFVWASAHSLGKLVRASGVIGAAVVEAKRAR